MERENLENSTIRNVKKKFHEKIKFLFIGQGQVDTWHHLRGLPEAFSPRNLEKNAISHNCVKWKIHQHHFRLLEAFRMVM